MKNILLTILIGLCAGTIDILPMIKMKQGLHSIASAFSLYFIAPFFIFSTNLLGMPWWMNGAVITLLMALPNMLYIAKSEKKAIPIIILMATVLGTLIGIAGHILEISL